MEHPKYAALQARDWAAVENVKAADEENEETDGEESRDE